MAKQIVAARKVKPLASKQVTLYNTTLNHQTKRGINAGFIYFES
jgi:hypothetical protein|tara:strand:- start:118 stop:249 length:132 start_codon:yes stop_codon:yes gene_type:complete